MINRFQLDHYQVPDYVYDIASFVQDKQNKNVVGRREKLFLTFNIESDLYKTIFAIVCLKIIEKKGPVYFDKIVDTIEEYRSKNNVNYIQNFPTTTVAALNTLENLIQMLDKFKVVMIDDSDPTKRKLVLIPFDIPKKSEKNSVNQKLYEYLNGEWSKLHTEFLYPYPSYKMTEHFMDKEIHHYCTYPIPPFEQVDEELFQSFIDEKLIIPVTLDKIDNPDNLIMTPYQYQNLIEITGKKTHEYLQSILDEKETKGYQNMFVLQINNLLVSYFSDARITLQSLMAKKKTGQPFHELLSVESENLKHWVYIFRELLYEFNQKWQNPSIDQIAAMQTISLAFQYSQKNHEKQIKLKKQMKFEQDLVTQLAGTTHLIKSEVKKMYVNNLIPSEKKEDYQYCSDSFDQFIDNFIRKNSMTDDNYFYIFEIIVNHMEYLIHSDKAIPLFEKYLTLAQNPVSGIRNTAFIKPAQDIIQNINWNQNVYDALKSDEKFLQFLIDNIQDYYPELFDIYHYFRDHENEFKFIVSNSSASPSKYLQKGGHIKPLQKFLNINRYDILKEIEDKTSFLDQIIHFFMIIFPFFFPGSGKKIRFIKMMQNENKKLKKTKKKKETELQETDLIKEDLPDKKQTSQNTSEEIKKAKVLKNLMISELNIQDLKSYMNKKIQSWSLTPKEDSQIVKRMLTEKKNSRFSRLDLIQKELLKINSVESLMDLTEGIAKHLLQGSQKKHIKLDDLKIYITLTALMMIESKRK